MSNMNMTFLGDVFLKVPVQVSVSMFEVHGGKYIFYSVGNCIMSDLNVPSYFQSGRPTRHYLKRQQRWNRYSLAVNYNLKSREVCVSKLYYNGGKLKEVTSNIRRLQHVFAIDEKYEKRFRRSYAWGQLRTSIANFVQRPRVPRLEHLRYLFRRGAPRP